MQTIDNLTNYEARVDASSGITTRSVITGGGLAIALCAMNSYLTLSFGVIEEGPTIAALFFFAFFFWTARKITTREMAIVATMGSAGGSLGFISNFYAAKSMTSGSYSTSEMIIFGIVSSAIGLLMAIPLRQLLIIKEPNLPWPMAKATGGVITALVEEGDPRQPKFLLITFCAMLILVIGNNDQGANWWPAEIAIPGLVAFGGAIAWSSPFAVGGSYLFGLRTCVGFLVGAIALMALGASGLADKEAPHHFFWPGLAFLVASGLTTIAVNWRTLTDAFRSLFQLRQGAAEDDDPILSGRMLAILSVLSLAASALLLHLVFHISFFLILMLIAVGGLIQNVISTRAQAITSFNPARVMGVLLQGICAMFGGRAAAINLTGAGFVGGSGAQAGMLTQDMVYGRSFRVPSRHQFWMQALTVIPCSIVSAWVFNEINRPGDLMLEGGRHAAPVAKMWAASALMFEQGSRALPEHALSALLVGGAIGAIYTLIECNKRLEKWIPDAIGIGLGLVLSPSLGITFFIGGILMHIVLGRWLKMKDITLSTIAIGCIVAEGIGGVLKPGLAKLGIIAG